jgi:hypothetical protein
MQAPSWTPNGMQMAEAIAWAAFVRFLCIERMPVAKLLGPERIS